MGPFGITFKIVIAEDTQAYLATRNESNYAPPRFAMSTVNIVQIYSLKWKSFGPDLRGPSSVLDGRDLPFSQATRNNNDASKMELPGTFGLRKLVRQIGVGSRKSRSFRILEEMPRMLVANPTEETLNGRDSEDEEGAREAA